MTSTIEDLDKIYDLVLVDADLRFPPPSSWLLLFHKGTVDTTGGEGFSWNNYVVVRPIVPTYCLPSVVMGNTLTHTAIKDQTPESKDLLDVLESVACVPADLEKQENETKKLNKDTYDDNDVVLVDNGPFASKGNSGIEEYLKDLPSFQWRDDNILRSGIRNRGNQCYLIAAIQFLFSLPLLSCVSVFAIPQNLLAKRVGFNSVCMFLKRLLVHLSSPSLSTNQDTLKVIGSMQLYSLVCQPKEKSMQSLFINHNMMQDCGECLSFLLDVINQEEMEILNQSLVQPNVLVSILKKISLKDKKQLFSQETRQQINEHVESPFFFVIQGSVFKYADSIMNAKFSVPLQAFHESLNADHDKASDDEKPKLNDPVTITLQAWVDEYILGDEEVEYSLCDDPSVEKVKCIQKSQISVFPPCIFFSVKRSFLPGEIVNRLQINPFSGLSLNGIGEGQVHYEFTSAVIHRPGVPDNGRSGHYMLIQKNGKYLNVFDDHKVIAVFYDEHADWKCFQGIGNIFSQISQICVTRVDHDLLMLDVASKIYVDNHDFTKSVLNCNINRWFCNPRVNKVLASKRDDLCSLGGNSLLNYVSLSLSMRFEFPSVSSNLAPWKLYKSVNKTGNPTMFENILFAFCFVCECDESKYMRKANCRVIFSDKLLANILEVEWPFIIVASMPQLSDAQELLELIASYKLSVVDMAWAKRCIIMDSDKNKQRKIAESEMDQFLLYKQGVKVNKNFGMFVLN